MDGGAWKAAVHGVTEGRTQLSDFTFTFHFHALKKEMATHSSVLAWRIPGMGEPGGLPSLGLHRVGHNWSDSAEAAVPMAIKYSLIVALPLALREGWQGYQRSQRDSPSLSTLDMEHPCFYVRKLRLAWMGQGGALFKKKKKKKFLSFPGILPACQYRRHRFNPWSGKMQHDSEQLSPCATTVEATL